MQRAYAKTFALRFSLAMLYDKTAVGHYARREFTRKADWEPTDGSRYNVHITVLSDARPNLMKLSRDVVGVLLEAGAVSGDGDALDVHVQRAFFPGELALCATPETVHVVVSHVRTWDS